MEEGKALAQGEGVTARGKLSLLKPLLLREALAQGEEEGRRPLAVPPRGVLALALLQREQLGDWEPQAPPCAL